MILERGIILPQALFKTLNPAITAATINIKEWVEDQIQPVSERAN